MRKTGLSGRWLCVLLVLGVTAGCGGGGGGRGRAPTDMTRLRVQGHLGTAFGALTLSGAQSGRMASLMNGAPGMSRGASMLGGFFRAASLAARALAAGSEGSSGGGGSDPEPGWDGSPGFYYDEWLGLWVEVEETPSSSTFRLYEDEGKTKPAGLIVSTWPADWGVYPQRHTYAYQITAGLMAGSTGTTEVVLESEAVGGMTYDHTWAGGWKSRGSAAWRAGKYSWNNRSEEPGGFWSVDTGEFADDGSGTSYSENSLGYRSRFVFYADGSGKGTIEGPDAGLPATITWDAEGHVRIVWADGTVEEYNWYGCVEAAAGEVPGGSGG